MRVKKRKASATRRNHRRFGVFAAVFVIFMVLSGLALNHSHGLGLDRRHVSQPLLLDWYGFAKLDQIDSFALGDDWLSFAGSQLYLNGKSAATLAGGLGAVISGDLLIAAGNDELVLLDRNGELIERLSWDQAAIESLGLLEDNTVVIKTKRQLWLADDQLLTWQPDANMLEKPVWSVVTETPTSLRQLILQNYRGDGLSLEQVLLDLHSGRIFGTLGIIVYDLLALALGFLAISGLVLWVRGRRNGNRNGKRNG